MKIDPYSIFLQAMRSPVTKKKYTRRIEMFFDFLQISGDSTKIVVRLLSIRDRIILIGSIQIF